jgi:hypothetical protein
MEWSDVGEWLKGNAGGVAGLVGSLLVGNVPGAIAAGVSIVTNATGARDPDAALAQLQGNPEALMKLREIAVQSEASVRDHLFRMEQARYTDIANAREREVKSGDTWTPRALAVFVTIGFFGVLGVLLYGGKPPAGGDALLVMLGSLGAAWGGIIAYYFGSSAGSSEKTALLAKRG